MSISGGFQNTDGFLCFGNAVEHGVGNVLFVFGDEKAREAVLAELAGLDALFCADNERGHTAFLIDDLHGCGLGARQGEAGRRGRAYDHAIGRNGVLDLFKFMERSDGVKEYNPRDQNENERYNGKNVRAGADACADVKEHQQSEHRADSNEPAPVATPVFLILS